MQAQELLDELATTASTMPGLEIVDLPEPTSHADEEDRTMDVTHDVKRLARTAEIIAAILIASGLVGFAYSIIATSPTVELLGIAGFSAGAGILATSLALSRILNHS